MKKAVFIPIFFLLVFFFSGYSATLSNIQKGTTTLPAGSGSVTQAITAVNLSRSFLVFSIRTNSNQPGQSQIGGQLTATNQITFDRNDAGGTPAVTIEWQVFEFSSGVSVQRGSVAGLPQTGTNVTITSVNTSRSFVTVNIRKDGGQYGSDDFVTADLTSSTNIFIDRENGGANPQMVYWQVVEWTGASVQKITATLSAGVDSLAVTLPSSVTKSKTMVLGNHRADGDLNSDDFPITELLDNNTVIFTRTGTARNCHFVVYVVSFTDNTDVVHGAIRMTAAQNNVSTTICSVTAASSGIIPPSNYFRSGSNCEATDDDMAITYATINLTSSTTVNATRSGTGFAALFPFQVLEFTAATPSGCTPTEPGASAPRTINLCNVTLPIELLNFKATKLNEENVRLDWQTATEINNDHFELERSIDGYNFIKIATVDGAGNSNVILNYDYLDSEIELTNVCYYRLKQVDFDGKYSYSEIETVIFEDKPSLLIYPNPSSGNLTIVYKGDMAKGINIYDSVGKLVKKEFFNNEYKLRGEELSKGVYFVEITNKENTRLGIEKLVIK